MPEIGGVPLNPADGNTGGLFTITAQEFSAFRELIHQEAGISLSDAKRQLVCSRLSKRLRHLKLESFSQYFDYLMNHDPGGEERLQMINCITTNKTDFFRENHHFEFLRDQVIPGIRDRALRGRPKKLRIWSAASSSGEEPYSIAMTVREALGGNSGWDAKILASDIDTVMLQAGEQGVYKEDKLADVPEELLRRYFLRGRGEWDGYFKVKRELSDMISFRRVNLIEHPWPFKGPFDAIFCRNVVIYFGRATQQALFERIARVLSPDGYLFVGHSENLYWMSDLLEPLPGTIYRLRQGGNEE
jgi:chemotaxis protein methyltransferase CheR